MLLQLPCVLSQQLQTDIQVRNNEMQREARKKEKLERELQQSRIDFENKMSDTKNLQGQIDRYKQDISKMEQQVKEQRVSDRERGGGRGRERKRRERGGGGERREKYRRDREREKKRERERARE